ncbi:MAG TPA: hypothetical protein DCL29_08885 [Eubacterium sp.]|nr:hypothetical protein [Eubacterium sp.]
MNDKVRYRDLFKKKNYRKFIFSNLINRFGDSIDAIALTWLVYQITHSGAWSAIIFGLYVLPNVVVQPFAGAYVEKLNKKKVIVGTHILRFGIISFFALLYMNNLLNPYMTLVFALLITSIESFNLPAGSAFLPMIVDEKDIPHVLSINSALSSAACLVGTGAAGIIISKFGIGTAMLIDALTFLIAGILVSSIKVLTKDVKEKIQGEKYLDTLKNGLGYIRSNKVVVNLCIVMVIANLSLVPLNSLLAPIANEGFGLGSDLLSVIGIANAVGAILGAILVPRVQKKLNLKQMTVCTAFILGVFMCVLTTGRFFKGEKLLGYAIAGLSFFIMNLFASMFAGLTNIYFLKSVKQEFLSRAAAVFGAIAAASIPVGSFVVSMLVAIINAMSLVFAAGIIMLICAVVFYLINLEFEIKEETENTESENKELAWN